MLTDSEFDILKCTLEEEVALVKEKRDTLKNLDFFALDNSLRETAVGQSNYTLEDKWAILEEVKKCGFKNIVVASFYDFSDIPRVDDTFVEELVKKEEDLSCFYAFTEVGKLDELEYVPVGMTKMKKYGLRNPIIEIDLANQKDPNFTSKMCALLKERIKWTLENLAADAKIFVNFRDLPFSMQQQPRVVLEIVKFLAKMTSSSHLYGLMFEDPTGSFFPELVIGWTKIVRKCMDDNGWQDGNLLVHIHKKWGYAYVTQIDCLAAGANGVWACICEEGVGVGHASLIVTIMNLMRMGNEKIKSAYNCRYLRDAAINITKITTGRKPYPKHIVYGDHALDMTVDFLGKPSEPTCLHDLNIAKFFGLKAPKQLSTSTSTKVVLEKLRDMFGEDEQFTEEIATQMKSNITEDVSNNRKEEYMSRTGLALLFERAGGKLTATMRNVIQKVVVTKESNNKLLAEVKKTWDDWDLRQSSSGNDGLEFYFFYNAFMYPYFECEIALKALQAIDMNINGNTKWSDFCVYLMWALHEYPEISTTSELLDIAFTKGIIPAMHVALFQK